MLKQTTQIISPGVTKWDEKAILIAHGCAPLERFTGKSYEYCAVNLETSASAHLCHKRRPISESKCKNLNQQFLESGTVSGSEHCIDAKSSDTKSQLPETLTHIFENITLEYRYSLCAEQLALAMNILETIYRCVMSLIAEMPVV